MQNNHNVEKWQRTSLEGKGMVTRLWQHTPHCQFLQRQSFIPKNVYAIVYIMTRNNQFTTPNPFFLKQSLGEKLMPLVLPNTAWQEPSSSQKKYILQGLDLIRATWIHITDQQHCSSTEQAQWKWSQTLFIHPHQVVSVQRKPQAACRLPGWYLLY